MLIRDRPLWKLFSAFILVAAAGGFRLAFLRSLGENSPFLTFYPAVALSAILGGLLPGALATLLSVLFADYFWMEPVATFGILSEPDWGAAITFFASGVIISVVSEVMHRATQRAKVAEADAVLAAEHEKAAVSLRESMEQYRMLFKNMLNGLAYCKMIFDDGRPHDFIYLAVNPAFENLTGLRDVVGRKVTEVIPGFRETYPELLEIYGRVALSGLPERHEIFIKDPGIWLDISVYSASKDHFTAVFENITDRKEMISRIKRNEEEWEKTFNSVPDLIAIIDSDYRIVRVNRAMAERLGKTPEQCIGLHCYQYVHELPHPPDYCPHAETLKDGREHVSEVHFFDSEWLVSTSPIFDAVGDIAGAVHVARDITDRKRIENELRNARDELETRVRERTVDLVSANEKLREQAALIDLSPDAILVRDMDDRISFWSKGSEATYGYKADEALGKRTNELLGTRSSDSIEDIEKSVLSQGRWSGELLHTTSGGDEIVVESRWSLKPGKDERNVGFLEINRDVTAKKRTEEMLRRANRALKALSQCNEALVRETEEMELLKRICHTVVEVGGYLMAWVGLAENDEAKSVRPISFAGYEDGYLSLARITWADEERGRGPVGTSIRTGEAQVSKDLMANPHFNPWRKNALERGYSSCISLPLVVAGQAFGALAIYAPEPDAFDEEEVRFLTSLAENVSHGIGSIRTSIRKKEAEEAMRSYMERLERSNTDLEEFAFIASHDLQEPMRKIQTFGGLLRKGYSGILDVTVMDYLTKIENSANRMRSLIDALLKYSRVTRSTEPFREIDLTNLVAGAVEEFDIKLKESGGTIRVAGLPVIQADASQMYQLFQHLIGNALKFRSSDRPPIIQIYGKEDAEACRIYVEDNGVGFDEKYLPLIFKPFQQLHGREYEGTGMGLSICRKIVEQHGGTITARSKPGRGTTIIFTLPLKRCGFEQAA